MVPTHYGCVRGGPNLFWAHLPNQFLEPLKLLQFGEILICRDAILRIR